MHVDDQQSPGRISIDLDEHVHDQDYGSSATRLTTTNQITIKLDFVKPVETKQICF